MSSSTTESERKQEDDDKKDEDLAVEDLALKEMLEAYVIAAVKEKHKLTQKCAIGMIRRQIGPSGTLLSKRFLRPHYGTLQAFNDTMPDDDTDMKKMLADILSLLSASRHLILDPKPAATSKKNDDKKDEDLDASWR